MLRSFILFVAALGLAACSLSSLKTANFSYVRSDGQDIGDPALAQQFKQDRVACEVELQKGLGASGGNSNSRQNNNVAAGSDAVTDCMEARGYTVVLARDAEAMQQELAAKAAEKARREAEAAAPPPPPAPPPPQKVKVKPKPKPEAPATASSPPPAQPKSSPN